MNKIKKIFNIVGIILICIPIIVSAEEITPRYYTYETYNYDWTWNYKTNAYYYIVDLSSKFITATNEAASSWFKTGYHKNPLYPMTRKTTQSGSPMDFYKKNLEENQLGEVNMFLLGGSEIQYDSHGYPAQDWRYCKIYIDENHFNQYFGYATEDYQSMKRKVLIMHEMGHCFGLAHAASDARVMWRALDTTTATGMTYHDSAALVYKLTGSLT